MRIPDAHTVVEIQVHLQHVQRVLEPQYRHLGLDQIERVKDAGRTDQMVLQVRQMQHRLDARLHVGHVARHQAHVHVRRVRAEAGYRRADQVQSVARKRLLLDSFGALKLGDYCHLSLGRQTTRSAQPSRLFPLTFTHRYKYRHRYIFFLYVSSVCWAPQKRSHTICDSPSHLPPCSSDFGACFCSTRWARVRKRSGGV